MVKIWNVKSKKQEISGLSAKSKCHHYHLGAWRDHKQGQQKKGKQTAQTIIEPCNCGRKLGKITNTGKKDTRKGMGYNKGWGTCTNIRIY